MLTFPFMGSKHDLYTGAVIDTETGLYYMNARYYDPETGRFISQDSFRGGGEIFWHLYAYCDGDPVNSTDPTGHVYNRSKAYKYAMKWWNGRNHYYYSYGEDCANFVSQCLYAGGKQGGKTWHSRRYRSWSTCRFTNNDTYRWDVSEAWRLVKEQYKYFKAKRTVITIKSGKDIKKWTKKVKVGDPGYFDYGGGGEPGHAVMVSGVNSKDGKITYAAHCNNHRTQSLGYFFQNTRKVRFILYV